MSRRGRHRNRPNATTSTAAPGVPTVTTPATASAIDPREYVYDAMVQLARSSFAAISNPRRRRLRRGDGNYHCDYRTVEDLRDISRWLEYHSTTYSGALQNWSQYLVGGGPEWVPETADKEWNRKAAALLRQDFKDKRHDVRGRFTWSKWIRLLATSIVRDGGMGIVHTATGPAQLIEAERVVAVDTDRIGRITTYQVAETRNGFIDPSTTEPLSPAMMDWLPVVTRVSQDLGVPMLFSSLDDHDGISDLWQAEIDSATESSRPWIRLEHDSTGQFPGGQTIPGAMEAANNSAPATAPSARGDTKAGWLRTPNGHMMGVPKGLKSIVHQPERPNLDVPEFSKQVLRMACMMLLPYEYLFGDQADISYSNGRSIRKLGNALLNCFRGDFLNAPLERIALALLRQHIVAGDIGLPEGETDPKAWRKGSWKWDELPEHDRIKERQADALDLANGTASLKELNGENWQDTLDQRAAEYGHAAELVAKHNAKYPKAPITIHSLIGDPAHTAQLAVSLGISADPETTKPAATKDQPQQAPSGTKREPQAEPAASPS